MAAEAAISSAVQLLGDLLIQKVKFRRGVEGKVQLLKDELKRMQSFLEFANKKQAEDERVRNWISEIRELAQDAEDAIELFLLNVENARNRGLFKSITSFTKRMHHLDTIGEEIESIRARLDAIDKSRERYGIKDLREAADSTWRSQVESRRRLAHWKKDEHLVGMEDDVKKLLRESILDEERKGLSIAVVEGMGGIGKSTLARTIYNHDDVVARRFDCRAWVVVSSEFTPQETIKQLILELPCSDKQNLLEEIQKLEESTRDKLFLQEKLQEMLHEQLQGKDYFIVLDDVWEKEHWESLSSAFPDEQGKTSKLLLTTRNKVIAKYGRYVHKMQKLDQEKSWELFLKKAFVDSTNGNPIELESKVRKILIKCDGLPLAISVVGGLLVETQSSGWEEVLNQIDSHLGKSESSVFTILELSYQNLSPQLKSCFLCLAFFKEDATIPAKRLVDIWVVQGLIKQEGRRTMEEIGRGYLDELINRNMVQVENLTFEGRVKSCHLHDLLRNVCLTKAEEIGFEILKGEERISSETSYKPRSRHCVVYGEDLETLSLNQNKHLRSLFLLKVHGNYIVNVRTPSRYWKNFQLLKTLDLDRIGLRRFPQSFRALIGLKYLRVRARPRVTVVGLLIYMSGGYHPLELPSWLDRLKKLEVLDMECVIFPNVPLKMDRLRYFHGYCFRAPKRVDNWKNIETLKYIRQKELLGCNSTLMASCRVRELGIYLDDESGSDHEFSRVRALLEKMENLVKLHLLWNNLYPIGTTIIPQLDNLTQLKLTGNVTSCLAASMLPPNLSRLTLACISLNEDPMTELGKLPKLLYLKFKMNAYYGERMQVLRNGFPCLKALSLQRMERLSRIDVEEGGMPQLKHLRIHLCPVLETKNLPEHLISTAYIT